MGATVVKVSTNNPKQDMFKDDNELKEWKARCGMRERVH